MPWCHREYTAEEIRRWIAVCEQALAEKSAFNFGVFSAEGMELPDGGGLNQLNKLHNFCNLGDWVRETKQQPGIATRVMPASDDFGFSVLGVTRIEIVAADGNELRNGVAKKPAPSSNAQQAIVSSAETVPWPRRWIPLCLRRSGDDGRSPELPPRAVLFRFDDRLGRVTA